MPTPDYKPQQPASTIMEMLRKKQQANGPDLADEIATLREEIAAPGLADEIAALREEIAALRTTSCPARSVILTGQEVVRELRRLRCEA